MREIIQAKFFPGIFYFWKVKKRQYRDNRYYNEQLYKSKGSFHF